MRASTFLASLLIAGVLGSPVYETENVIIYKTVVITEQPGQPTPTPEPVVKSPAASHVTHRPEFGNNRFHFSRFYSQFYSQYFSEYSGPPAPTPVQEEPKPKDTASPFSAPPPPPPPSSPPASATPPPSPPPSATPVAQPKPAETGEDGSPKSGGVTLLTTVNKWRSIYKLPTLKWDPQLEKNALKTGTDGGGVNQNHELNPGTYGQVIAPGMEKPYGDLGPDSPFELSFVAWLCEVSSDPQLKTGGVDQCDLVAKNLHISYGGTGHYEILTATRYTTIGCAFAKDPDAGYETPYQGLWVCDLGGLVE